jgi:hypothetical protein
MISCFFVLSLMKVKSGKVGNIGINLASFHQCFDAWVLKDDKDAQYYFFFYLLNHLLINNSYITLEKTIEKNYSYNTFYNEYLQLIEEYVLNIIFLT